MAITIMFETTGMDEARYDEVLAQLEKAGAGAPPGRLHHVCYKIEGGLGVSDVFDSMENFESFGKILIPILVGLGIDPGQPSVREVYNIIRG
jgi:hypothetical protein